MEGRNERGRFTEVNQYGKGRKPGSRNKLPPMEVIRNAIEELGPRWKEVMNEMAYSPSKADRKWFVQVFARLLPRKTMLELENQGPRHIIINIGSVDGAPIPKEIHDRYAMDSGREPLNLLPPGGEPK